MLTNRRSLLVVLAILAFSAALRAEPAASAKKPLGIEDLYRFDGPITPALSPDGKRLAYARHWIDATTKQARQSLWLVDGQSDRARGGEPGEPDARVPMFSPDGKWIVFLSTRPRPAGWKPTPPVPPESDPATDIWLVPANGGATIPLAGPDKPYGRVLNDGFYGRIAFSPDGRKLVFVADDGKDPRSPEEIAADVQVVRPDQGEGYTGYGPAQLWVAQLEETPASFAARRIDRLTTDDVWYGDPQWSPDGRSVVVHANRTDDRESARYSINKNFDLWLIDVQTRARQQVTSGPGPEVSPRFSPDGRRLVCLSVPRKGSHRDVFNLAVVTFGPGGPRTEIVFDHHRPDAGKPPHPAPLFPLPPDCWADEHHIIYHTAVGPDTKTGRIDLRTGKGELLPALAKDEKPDVQSFAGREALRRQLTPRGNAVLQERLRAEVRRVRWKNDTGQEIDGLLTVPPAEVAKPPYKLLLYPHGGPHSRSTQGFNFPLQVFAAHGYAVFQPNFRGSEGYGQAFIDADRFDFGGGDMRDILTGIDHLIDQKLIDRDRQFVAGVSYGGYMTCWLVGHTNRFRAAVAQNAVTDLNAMWGLSDIQSWTEWEFGGRPWEVPGAMRQHSPLTYAANVRTPTLILHARDDRRCPLPMGRMFYQALRARQVPTQMVIYPGEGHGIRQPRHQEDVLRRTLAWFQEHDRK
jgi:dipeptidyl aminopeptidase/acylaminoacyl peptidase